MIDPVERGLFMPAEWAPHRRCWMAWPCREECWGRQLEEAREATAEVAQAIAAFEPVTMVCNPEHVAEVSLRLGGKVAIESMDHDDSWIRDNGPTFLIDGQGNRAGVDWRFNAWGAKFHPYDRDQAVAERILASLKVERYESQLVLEGGAIHVDGEGTLITTESVLLNPNRNPGWDRESVERELKRLLRIEKVIWLKRGIVDDESDGNIDNLLTVAAPGKLLCLTTRDKKDANYEIFQENKAVLEAETDAAGRSFEILEVEQPAARKHPESGVRLSLSYVNLYIADGGVVMPSFDSGKDDDAYEIVQDAFPGREVTQVPASDIVYGGGGIHSITQQQPHHEPPKEEEGEGDS